MARQADRLIKIGLEGFAAIDESFGRAKRPPVLKIPNPHPPSQIPVTKVIDSDEAAQLNSMVGGVILIIAKENQFPFKDLDSWCLIGNHICLACITSSSTCIIYSPAVIYIYILPLLNLDEER
uniref:Uncharacterized protein n=1 Tax=Populus trichocarpa TaxID=3694 RepID=A0A2K1ZKY0_POPTR